MSLERVRGRLPRAPLPELCAAALVTGALAVFFTVALPPHGDASAHFYRTFLVRRGDFLWDNYWYGGEYPLASYSLLYYLPAALLGNTVVAVAAAVAGSVVFTALAWDAWGEDARWAVRLYSVFAVEPILQTEYPFALAVPLLLASLACLRRGRTRLGALLAALTLGVSPLAFAFLCLAAAGLFLVRPRRDRRAVASSLALGFLVLCAGALSWSFATPWAGYPFPASALMRILVVSGLGVVLAAAAAPRWSGGGIYAVWGLAGLIGFVVPTPIGSNLDRPAFLLVPLLLVPTARLAPRAQVVAAMGVFVVLTFSTGNLQSSLASAFVPHENEVRLWRPVVDFLRRHDSPSFRVEVVPTAGHWEAYFLPRAGIPIARSSTRGGSAGRGTWAGCGGWPSATSSSRARRASTDAARPPRRGCSALGSPVCVSSRRRAPGATTSCARPRPSSARRGSGRSGRSGPTGSPGSSVARVRTSWT
jgi:hypothetical protein